MRVPWVILVGVAILAASLVPAWTIDLGNAPVESELRLWTTVLLAIALLALLNRVALVRWLLLALLGTGVVVSIWSFVAAATIEMMSAAITIAQMVGLAMFFTPAANRWFRKPVSEPVPTDR